MLTNDELLYEALAIEGALIEAGLVSVAYETRGGKVLSETFFTKSLSGVKVTIDWTYTEQGGIE